MKLPMSGLILLLIAASMDFSNSAVSIFNCVNFIKPANGRFVHITGGVSLSISCPSGKDFTLNTEGMEESRDIMTCRPPSLDNIKPNNRFCIEYRKPKNIIATIRIMGTAKEPCTSRNLKRFYEHLWIKLNNQNPLCSKDICQWKPKNLTCDSQKTQLTYELRITPASLGNNYPDSIDPIRRLVAKEIGKAYHPSHHEVFMNVGVYVPPLERLCDPNLTVQTTIGWSGVLSCRGCRTGFVKAPSKPLCTRCKPYSFTSASYSPACVPCKPRCHWDRLEYERLCVRPGS